MAPGACAHSNLLCYFVSYRNCISSHKKIHGICFCVARVFDCFAVCLTGTWRQMREYRCQSRRGLFHGRSRHRPPSLHGSLVRGKPGWCARLAGSGTERPFTLNIFHFLRTRSLHERETSRMPTFQNKACKRMGLVVGRQSNFCVARR